VRKRHFHSLCGALTLAGAIVAVVLFVVPAALGKSTGDKFQVLYYTAADNGNRVTHIGANQKFEIHGNNLGKAIEVFCFAGKDDDDLEANSPKGLDDLENWEFSGSGKLLVDAQPDPDCAGHKGPITVLFPGKVYISGPDLAIG
jgi:hypothetical protein